MSVSLLKANARRGIEKARIQFERINRNAEVNTDDLNRARQIAKTAAGLAVMFLDETAPEWATEGYRELVRDMIENDRQQYLRTGNPMYVCSGYNRALSIDDPRPDWAIAWID